VNHPITCRAPEVQRLVKALGLEGQRVLGLQLTFDPGEPVNARADLLIGEGDMEEVLNWEWVAVKGRKPELADSLEVRFARLEAEVRGRYAALGRQITRRAAEQERAAWLRHHG